MLFRLKPMAYKNARKKEGKGQDRYSGNGMTVDIGWFLASALDFYTKSRCARVEFETIDLN